MAWMTRKRCNAQSLRLHADQKTYQVVQVLVRALSWMWRTVDHMKSIRSTFIFVQRWPTHLYLLCRIEMRPCSTRSYLTTLWRWRPSWALSFLMSWSELDQYHASQVVQRLVQDICPCDTMQLSWQCDDPAYQTISSQFTANLDEYLIGCQYLT